jgi:hypothetical protein
MQKEVKIVIRTIIATITTCVLLTNLCYQKMKQLSTKIN